MFGGNCDARKGHSLIKTEQKNQRNGGGSEKARKKIKNLGEDRASKKVGKSEKKQKNQIVGIIGQTNSQHCQQEITEKEAVLPKYYKDGYNFVSSRKA